MGPIRMSPSPMVACSTLEEYKTILERKRAAIQQMCQGLEEYLTIDLDAAIEAIEHPTPRPDSPAFAVPPMNPWKPTEEEFLAACAKVETLEGGIAESRAAIEGLATSGPEAAMAASLRMQLGYFEDMLETAKRTRDGMQKMLEAEQTEATE